MLDSDFNLDLYKIPSEEILRNRHAFYGLQRRKDHQTATWLKVIQNCIGRCDYPKIVMEILLFDQFVCGLNASELESIKSISESWTFKQLLQHYRDRGDGSEPNQVDSMTINERVTQSENINLDAVKTEPVRLSH